MDMVTTEDSKAAKVLLTKVHKPLLATKARRVWATVEKSNEGPVVCVHSPFLDGKNVVRSVAEAVEVAERSEAARLAGVQPRERRV